MKKLAVIFILFITLLFQTGCDKEKPQIAFSKTPFNSQGHYNITNTFHTKEKIYYAIYNPDGFKTRLLKLQVFKKESEKSEFFGYEYLYNRAIELSNKNAYTDYIVINNKGYYIFQVFDYTDFLKPVVIGVIKVE